jgi:hypothetical protein
MVLSMYLSPCDAQNKILAQELSSLLPDAAYATLLVSSQWARTSDTHGYFPSMYASRGIFPPFIGWQVMFFPLYAERSLPSGVGYTSGFLRRRAAPVSLVLASVLGGHVDSQTEVPVLQPVRQ